MAVKVSVVVPVYNPGPHIDKCLESLLGQTLSSDELELVFVDDGSTDETPARLDELAAEHNHVRVVHIPNSGWPGKPRNVGVDHATGEYIQYVDQDDWMAPDALRRLHELAVGDSADVAIGKVISNWRSVPAGLWRQTQHAVTIRSCSLWDSLTPHKMFRREFLLANGIRFPEGKRRLEDQLYMMQAYFAASAVSILGDYTCYYYWRRTDGKNSGSTRIDPAGYYDNLREVLDVVTDNTEPGEFRDRIMRRFYRAEILQRLSPAPLLKYDPDYRQAMFAEVRKITEERITDEVVDALPATLRLRSALLREDRLEDLLRFAERCVNIRPVTRLERIAWTDDAVLRLPFVSELRRADTDEPVGGWRDGERVFLDPAISEGLLDWRLGNVDAERRSIRAEVSIRNRETAVEWSLPCRCEVHFERASAALAESATSVGSAEVAGSSVPMDGESQNPSSDETGRVRVFVRGSFRIDPATAAGGKPLGRGIWDVAVRILIFGWDQRTRPGTSEPGRLAAECQPAILGAADTVVVPYLTAGNDNFSLDIDRRAKQIAGALGDRRATPAYSGAEAFEVRIPVVCSSRTAPMPCEVALREASASGLDALSRTAPASVVPGSDGWARVRVQRDDLPDLTVGRWRIWGRLDEDDVPEMALGELLVDQSGRPRLVGAPAVSGARLSTAAVARLTGAARRARRFAGRAARATRRAVARRR